MNIEEPPDRVIVQNVNHPGSERTVSGPPYRAVRDALLEVLPATAPGLTYDEMLAAIVRRLPEELFPAGERAGWWLKTVQLDLEAKGELVREPTRPLRWHRGGER